MTASGLLERELVLSHDVARGAAADQEQVELKLVEGDNHLLIKIMNYGGAAGFYFARKDPGGLPPEILQLLHADPFAPVMRRSSGSCAIISARRSPHWPAN